MKRIVNITTLIALLFLCSCSEKMIAGQYEFPKTTWGMNMQETLEAYGVTKEDTQLYNENGRGAAFILEDYELFGENSSRILFNYIDFANNGNYELCGVQITYPENVDMKNVLYNMQKMYGDTISEIITYDLYNAVTDENIYERKYTESENLKIWANETLEDLIPKEESEIYEQNWEFFQNGLNKNNWNQFSQNARMVTVIWSTEETLNTIEFNAYNLGVYTALKSQLEEQQ